MSGERGKGAAVFIASACVSLVVLGSCLLLFLLYMKAAQAEAVKNDVTVPLRYHPASSESLQILMLACEEPEDPPELIADMLHKWEEGFTLVFPARRRGC